MSLEITSFYAGIEAVRDRKYPPYVKGIFNGKTTILEFKEIEYTALYRMIYYQDVLTINDVAFTPIWDFTHILEMFTYPLTFYSSKEDVIANNPELFFQ